VNTHNYPGLFIVIDGIDGSGKSTLVKNLASALHSYFDLGINTTYEPHRDSPYCKLKNKGVGREFKTDLGMYTASRLWHLANVIMPWLKNGDVVISDRYYYSTYAYQCTSQTSLIAPVELHNMYSLLMPHPDISIILDIPVADAIRRIKKRPVASRGMINKSVLHRAAGCYKQFCSSLPGCISIDATGPPDDVLSKILAYILDARI